MSEPVASVFVGELVVPPGTPEALVAMGSGPVSEPHRSSLRREGLLDDDEGLVSQLAPIVSCLACPELTLAIDLRYATDGAHAQGWLNPDQSVLAIPGSPARKAVLRLLCFPTVHLAHRLGAFLGLGPRPLRDDLGAVLINRSSFERIAGSGFAAAEARAIAELPDADADPLLGALSDQRLLRWSVVLRDAATTGERFHRRVEAVDGGEEGLWLVGPAGEQECIAVTPATTTQAWQLLSTMLPTQEETVSLQLGAQAPG